MDKINNITDNIVYVRHLLWVVNSSFLDSVVVKVTDFVSKTRLQDSVLTCTNSLLASVSVYINQG